MLRKINRFLNTLEIRLVDRDTAFRIKHLMRLARKLQSSENELVQTFGDGMAMGIEEQLEENKITRKFAEKYIDRTFPSILTARDLWKTYPGSHKWPFTKMTWFKLALAYPNEYRRDQPGDQKPTLH